MLGMKVVLMSRSLASALISSSKHKHDRVECDKCVHPSWKRTKIKMCVISNALPKGGAMRTLYSVQPWLQGQGQGAFSHQWSERSAARPNTFSAASKSKIARALSSSTTIRHLQNRHGHGQKIQLGIIDIVSGDSANSDRRDWASK